jgi:AraC family transcriptional regulator
MSRLRFVETSYQAGTVLRHHAHEYAHLCYVLEGDYLEQFGSTDRERTAASLTYLPAGLSHGESHRRYGRHFLVELAPALVEEAFDGRPPRTAMSLARGSGPLLGARLHAHLRDGSEDDQEVAYELVCELLALCHAPLTAERPAWLARTLAALRDRYRETVRLAELARDAGVHPVHLAQVFRKARGCTVGEFVRRLRVEHACRELVSGCQTLSQIALAAGFADQSHLSRCFRRVMRRSPGQYRRLASRRGLP